MPENLRRQPSTWAFLIRNIIPAVIAILLVSCTGSGEIRDPYSPLRAELSPFVAGERSDTPSIRTRYDGCADTAPALIHDTWGYPSLGGTMAVHVWRTIQSGDPLSPPRGTVLLIHGYVATPCELTSVLRALLREGFVVVAPELPGHGLSDGPRADIGSFADYGRFLADLDPILLLLPEPYDVVAHSTGASAVIERLRSHGDPYDRIVLLAPLVRSQGYRMSRVFRALTRPFIDTVPARNTEDFGSDRVPLHWFDALVAWNRELDNAPRPISNRELLIIQGQSDRVVAWRYNLRVLEELLPGAVQLEIPHLEHVPTAGTDAGRAAIDATRQYLNMP